MYLHLFVLLADNEMYIKYNQQTVTDFHNFLPQSLFWVLLELLF